jgi:hypothetical protein
MSDMKTKMSILSVAVILLTGCGSSDDSSNSQVTNEGSTAIKSPADPLNANYYIDIHGNFEVTYLDRDSETSFDQPPTIEIVGVTEIDMENNSFNFSCRDTAGFCLS